jgi:single-strand DNA-binding protein
MKSLNRLVLIGYLASDPELRQTKTGESLVTFALAVHRDTAADGTRARATDYHRIVCLGKLADICGKYLSKGQAVSVEGTIQNRAYERDGRRHYTTEIVATEVNMVLYIRKGDSDKVLVQQPELAA